LFYLVALVLFIGLLPDFILITFDAA